MLHFLGHFESVPWNFPIALKKDIFVHYCCVNVPLIVQHQVSLIRKFHIHKYPYMVNKIWTLKVFSAKFADPGFSSSPNATSRDKRCQHLQRCIQFINTAVRRRMWQDECVLDGLLWGLLLLLSLLRRRTRITSVPLKKSQSQVKWAH